MSAWSWGSSAAGVGSRSGLEVTGSGVPSEIFPPGAAVLEEVSSRAISNAQKAQIPGHSSGNAHGTAPCATKAVHHSTTPLFRERQGEG